MKKVVFNLFFVAVLTTLTALTSCDKNDKRHVGYQVSGSLNQTLYADQTEGHSLTFTANGLTATTSCAWTSIIEPIENSSWISITPDSGDASKECTVSINLKPNTSGVDRVAVILINFPYILENEVATMRIHITQKATTEDGLLYEVANPDYDIPDIPCPCEETGHQYLGAMQLLTGGVEAYLFRDSIPRQKQLDFYYQNTSDFVCWIIINGELGNDWIHFNRNHDYRLEGDGKICNLPDLANVVTGSKVYIEGLMYAPPCWGSLGNHISFDFVLSKFKRIDD